MNSDSSFSGQQKLLLLILAAVNFTHMVDFVIIMPLGQRLMTEFAISPNQFGHIVSVYGYAAAVASILASFVVDRFDRKRVLATMYAGFAASTLFCGLAWNYETMLLSRGLAGIFGGLAAAAIMAVIGDAFPPRQRGRATGAIMSAFAVASIAGLPIGLAIAGWFGRGAPFVALAGASLFVLTAMILYMPSMRGHIGKRRSTLAEFGRVVSERNHWYAFAFTLTLSLGAFTVASFIGPFLIAKNGWNEHYHLAIVYLVAGLVTLVGMNVIGRLSDRLGKRRVFLVFASGSIIMSLIATNLPAVPLWVAVAVFSAFMLCAAGRMVPAQAMLIGVSAPHNRGAFMSLNTAVQQFGTGLAPMIAGAILGESNAGLLEHYPEVGYVAAGIAVIALVLSGMIRPSREDAVTVPLAKEAATEAEPEAIAV